MNGTKGIAASFSKDGKSAIPFFMVGSLYRHASMFSSAKPYFFGMHLKQIFFRSPGSIADNIYL